MSDFLMRLYDEEMKKVSQADLAAFMDSLSVEELAAITGMEKAAAKMSLQRRESLPAKSFAVPAAKAKKIGVAGEIKGEAKGKYPIPDMKRARNALARVSQHGTPGERSAVRSKVYAKFPGLKEGFQERHGGASPTSKANIRKVEQGGIGKGASVIFMGKLAVAGPPNPEMPTGSGHETTDKSKKKGQLEPAADVKAEEEKKAAFWAKLATCKRAQGPGEEESGEAQNGGMEKEEDFTTPEAQAKAKVLSRAMKSTRGAPTNVRKAAVSVAAKQMRKVGAKSVRPETWMEGQKGQARALRKPGSKILADPELIKKRLKGQLKGLAIGAPLGAGAGALLGRLLSGKRGATALGAIIGGGASGLAGQLIGQGRADKKWLAERGIKTTKAGLGRGEFSAEAAKKYLGKSAKK
jgi:hypothetical protein